MDRDSCFQLGYIVRHHGLKGEVKAVFETDQPSDYTNLGSVLVDINGDLIPFFIESIRFSGNFFIIAFEDILTIEEAEELNGKQLWLPDDLLPELPPDQFYYHDIIGYTATDKKSGEIGRVNDYNSAGKQDILSIKSGDAEILIPMDRSLGFSIRHQEL